MPASATSILDSTATISHWIDGAPASADAAPTQNVFNPATGKVIRKVVLGTPSDVDRAVESARKEFAGWAATAPLRRARILNRFLHLMNEHRDELAALITSEHGKILSDAKGEVMRGI